MDFVLPLHLSDRWYLSLSPTLHTYHSIKIMNAQEPSPSTARMVRTWRGNTIVITTILVHVE